MLEEKDIQNLKEVLATKEDIKSLSLQLLPREEFENFTKVYKEDIKSLSLQLLPREEFEDFKREYKEDMNGLREMIQALVISADKLVKAVSDLSQEYSMIVSKVDRHEKWFKQVSEKLGIKLE